MRNHIRFEFYQCSQFHGKHDILRVVKTLQNLGIVLAVHHKEPGKPPQTSPYSGNAVEYVNQKYEEIELIDADEIPLGRRRGPGRLWGDGLIGNVVPGVNQSFSLTFDTWGKSFNMVDGSLITTRENVDRFASFFLQISLSLYPILSPTFGRVDYLTAASGDVFDEVPALETEKLYWATFLGPEYVRKYGKEYLLNAPVWNKVELPDGGVLLQLREYISSSAKSISLDEIEKYFAQVGVKYISLPEDEL